MKKLNLITRDGHSLSPADSYAEGIVSGMKRNTWYTAEIKRPRNPRHHSLVMALATICVHHAPERSVWHNQDPLLFVYAIMYDAGMVVLRPNMDGTFRTEVKHINFESMSEDEFEPVSDLIFSQAARVIGMDEQYLRDHYLEIFDDLKGARA